jgi:hypothetical protein
MSFLPKLHGVVIQKTKILIQNINLLVILYDVHNEYLYTDIYLSIYLPVCLSSLSFQPHYGPGVYWVSNRNEYQEFSWR